MKKRLEFLSPIYWPAWFAIGILWLITRLPYRIQLGIGKNIGRLLYSLPTSFKKITHTNIRLCFPELSKKKQSALAKKNFESLGIGLIEAAMAWWLPDDKLKNLFTVQGLDYIEAAFKKGNGVILLGPHFTCLEIVGRILGFTHAFAVMYRPHKKRLLAFIHEQFRKKHYLEYIPRHRVRQLIRTLNNNMAIWYAYDIDAGKKNSVFAPLFNIPTASLTSVSRIVRLTNAAIIPIGFHRLDDEFKYEVILYPPIEPFPTDSLKEDATVLNAAIEIAIRRKPEQYVWQYKRFKTRPAGEKRFY